MPRIYSGKQEYDEPGFAFLAGYDRSLERGQLREEGNRRNLELMLRFQDALVQTQQKRAKMIEEEALRRQQGQALDIQGKGLEKRAQDFLMPVEMQGPPSVEQEELATMLQTGETITDPKVREQFYGSLESYLGDLESARQDRLARDAIRGAGEDGLLDEQGVADMNMRLDTGEKPLASMKEIDDKRDQQVLDSMALQDTEQANAQAQAIIDSLPPGRSRDATSIVFQRWLGMPHRHRVQGAAQKMLERVQMLALLEQGELNRMRQAVIDRAQPGRDEKGNKTDFKWPETYGKRVTPDTEAFMQSRWWSPGGPQGQPRTAAMQQHIDRKKAEKEALYPGSTNVTGAEPKKLPEGEEGLKTGAEFAREADLVYRESMSAQQAVDQLEARGYDVDDPELAAIFRSVVQEIRESASKPRVAGQ